MSREYIDWLRQLPINRGGSRRSWVGVYSVDDGFESFEAWQQRIVERDAPKGVIARWLRWIR